MIVLDASALLAFLLNEPGAEEVADALDIAAMSTVNLAEVLSKVEERGGNAGELLAEIALLPIQMLPVSVSVALGAARLRSKTKAFGLSLGDRVCLAQAAELNCEAWTADRRWNDAAVCVSLHLIR